MSFDYVPELAVSELYLEFNVVDKKKEYDLKPVKVADGVNASSELAQKSFGDELGAAIIADQFVRDIMEMTEAEILFLIHQSVVRKSETTTDDIKALTQKIVEAKDALNKTVENLKVSAYASPDGRLI